MAEAWIRHYGRGRIEVFSAGTRPMGVHPLAVQVMAEHGVDISGQTSDPVTDYQDERFDWVVTVCDRAREECPLFPNAERRVHRGFRDPDLPEASPAAAVDAFRSVCTEIRLWAEAFVSEAVAVAGLGQA
jgi:arsenate reductase